jgi:hypothetical protein
MTTLPEPPFNRQTRRRSRRAAPSPNAFAYTIADAQAMGGPGRTKIYDLGKRGDLKLIKVAGRTMVDGASLRALLGVAA